MSNHSEIEHAVYDAIRKTINRFRENPLYTFTESDLHSYLHADMLSGNSKEFYATHKHRISLVHLEYPTNFRYRKDALLSGYHDLNPTNYKTHSTYIAANEKYGDRGNFDLVILNPDFITRLHEFLQAQITGDEKVEKPEHNLALNLINKDVTLAIKRLNHEIYNVKTSDSSSSAFEQEVLFAIEFKFIHPFNARNKNMIEEVIKDNEKLRLAHIHSNGFIKPINLIFCSSKSMERRDEVASVIDRLKQYTKSGYYPTEIPTHTIPDNVLNIFIESYIDNDIKKTDPPIAFSTRPEQWMIDLCSKLRIKINVPQSV
jgi:hypothetical protein